MFGIRFGSKKFLGIDIGTSSIRVIELSKKGRAFQLNNYGEVNTSLAGAKSINNVKKDALLTSDSDTAKAIELICKEAGISSREVNFSIPDFRSFFTSFKMPVMAKEELSEAIRYEVRPYIPLPLSEITLDWLVTEGIPSKTPLKVLVVAIPNEIINQYQNIADLSGLKLKVLESEVFALARASVFHNPFKNNKPGQEETVGLIDLGIRTSTCSIVEGGILKTSHSFGVSANSLTERLAKSLNIDYNKAEGLRDRYGLSTESQKAILAPLIDSLLEDIKKSFQVFSQEEGKDITRIVLAGGLSLLPGLKDYFSLQLKKEITISDPFSNVSYPQILEKTLKEKGPVYAIGVGLAMKGLE